MRELAPRPTRRSKAAATPTNLQAAPAAKSGFAIVGIGASAGGLEALELFLAPVRPDCGLAFVVVQHLDPSRKGLLVELLQRATAMPVVQITDRMRVAPGHVYVIPPNRELAISHGALHLSKPTAPRGRRLPIDNFFCSLADAEQERSIGVILSGLGSDGTLGLRAIKNKGGAVFVQTAQSAKFDGMPRSAIDAGLADVIAPAEQLADKIIAYLQHAAARIPQPDLSLPATGQRILRRLILFLRTKTGHDFSSYKKSSLYRRIERRMDVHGLPQLADYFRYLQENPQEPELLYEELLIGVTSFFRDPDLWQQLKTEAIPALFAAHPKGGKLRAWSAGCSTGEEAYSLAMIFREALEQLRPAANYSLQIFATDLDKQAIAKAREGVYPANLVAEVSATRLRRFFVPESRGYRVVKEIREMVIFAPQNLIMEPPITKLDVLMCRNLLIYLNADLQKRLLPLFHYSLNPDGILVLGTAESVGQTPELFVQLPGNTPIYRRRGAVLRSELVKFPAAISRPLGVVAGAALPQFPVVPPVVNVQALTDSLVLQRYSPAAVLTTASGDIVYISGRTGKYLEPAAGKTNVNLLAMARKGLGGALSEGFARAIQHRTTVMMKNVAVATNGGTQVVDVTAQFLSEPAVLYGMMLIVFADVASPNCPPASGLGAPTTAQRAQLAALTQQAQHSHEELQTTREQMQASQDELKSSNEELQSVNEELQSTNEELSTSQEEMQSMNEELQTVNYELKARVDELSRVSDDMKNLLHSTGIAALFLDGELNVRRFTGPTNNIIKLIPGDVGRPITDLVSELDYPALVEDAQEVICSLIPHAQQVAARDGRWFTVRIMPYRTQDDRIDGVVITFTDLSPVKRDDEAMGAALAMLHGRVTDAAAQLDKYEVLEGLVQKVQIILEKRLAEQQIEAKKTCRRPQADKAR